MVAGSGVFQKSAVLNDNNWNKFLRQLDHKLCSENSARLLPKGKYWRERFLVLGKRLPNVEMTHAGRLCFSSRMFWLICQTNALGTTWTCQSVFAADWQSCLWLASCWNISSVLCPLLAIPLTSYIQNLCRFWECCSKDHIEKSAIGSLTLKRSFVVCLHHASSSFALYRRNRTEQDNACCSVFMLKPYPYS